MQPFAKANDNSSESPTLETKKAKQRPVCVSTWGVRTSVGHVRKRNEDFWGEISGRWFVVADGMGGESGGEVAASTAVASLSLRAGEQVPDWGSLLEEVNGDVHRSLAAAGAPQGGTTLVAICFNSGVPSLAHIGDSRAYRLRRGELAIEPLTVDHSVAAELRAAGESVELYNRNIGRADALTRYIGGPSAYRPTSSSPVLSAGDRVLLCTDGVYGQLDPQAIASCLTMDGCGESADELVRLSDAAGGRDNATALVIEVAWE